MTSDISEHFQGSWRRALNASSLATLTPELIESWARERGLAVTGVEEREVGAFAKVQAIVLTVGEAKACFPKTPS